MQIAILLYPGITAMDAVGPFEVLQWLPGAKVRWVAETPGPIRSEGDRLAFLAEASLDEVRSPDIVVVPGGPGQAQLMNDQAVLDWIREADTHTRWTTSVCTGALLLGAAGLLDGQPATTYWLAMDELRKYGAEPVQQRVVRAGKLITAAGVTAGIDMALTLVGLECGAERAEAIQLGLEYDPQPPFASGSPSKAAASTVERLQRRSRFHSS